MKRKSSHYNDAHASHINEDIEESYKDLYNNLSPSSTILLLLYARWFPATLIHFLDKYYTSTPILIDMIHKQCIYNPPKGSLHVQLEYYLAFLNRMALIFDRFPDLFPTEISKVKFFTKDFSKKDKLTALDTYRSFPGSTWKTIVTFATQEVFYLPEGLEPLKRDFSSMDKLKLIGKITYKLRLKGDTALKFAYLHAPSDVRDKVFDDAFWQEIITPKASLEQQSNNIPTGIQDSSKYTVNGPTERDNKSMKSFVRSFFTSTDSSVADTTIIPSMTQQFDKDPSTLVQSSIDKEIQVKEDGTTSSVAVNAETAVQNVNGTIKESQGTESISFASKNNSAPSADANNGNMTKLVSKEKAFLNTVTTPNADLIISEEDELTEMTLRNANGSEPTKKSNRSEQSKTVANTNVGSKNGTTPRSFAQKSSKRIKPTEGSANLNTVTELTGIGSRIAMNGSSVKASNISTEKSKTVAKPKPAKELSPQATLNSPTQSAEAGNVELKLHPQTPDRIVKVERKVHSLNMTLRSPKAGSAGKENSWRSKYLSEEKNSKAKYTAKQPSYDRAGSSLASPTKSSVSPLVKAPKETPERLCTENQSTENEDQANLKESELPKEKSDIQPKNSRSTIEYIETSTRVYEMPKDTIPSRFKTNISTEVHDGRLKKYPYYHVKTPEKGATVVSRTVTSPKSGAYASPSKASYNQDSSPNASLEQCFVQRSPSKMLTTLRNNSSTFPSLRKNAMIARKSTADSLSSPKRQSVPSTPKASLSPRVHKSMTYSPSEASPLYANKSPKSSTMVPLMKYKSGLNEGMRTSSIYSSTSSPYIRDQYFLNRMLTNGSHNGSPSWRDGLL